MGIRSEIGQLIKGRELEVEILRRRLDRRQGNSPNSPRRKIAEKNREIASLKRQLAVLTRNKGLELMMDGMLERIDALEDRFSAMKEI
jgi:hypothetical protein